MCFCSAFFDSFYYICFIIVELFVLRFPALSFSLEGSGLFVFCLVFCSCWVCVHIHGNWKYGWAAALDMRNEMWTWNMSALTWNIGVVLFIVKSGWDLEIWKFMLFCVLCRVYRQILAWLAVMWTWFMVHVLRNYEASLVWFYHAVFLILLLSFFCTILTFLVGFLAAICDLGGWHLVFSSGWTFVTDWLTTWFAILFLFCLVLGSLAFRLDTSQGHRPSTVLALDVAWTWLPRLIDGRSSSWTWWNPFLFTFFCCHFYEAFLFTTPRCGPGGDARTKRILWRYDTKLQLLWSDMILGWDSCLCTRGDEDLICFCYDWLRLWLWLWLH